MCLYSNWHRVKRYLRIVEWAENRYRVGNSITVYIGDKPTAFKRIETAAASRYLREVAK